MTSMASLELLKIWDLGKDKWDPCQIVWIILLRNHESWTLKWGKKVLKRFKFIYNVKNQVCATDIRQNQTENYCYIKIVQTESNVLWPHRVECFWSRTILNTIFLGWNTEESNLIQRGKNWRGNWKYFWGKCF